MFGKKKEQTSGKKIFVDLGEYSEPLYSPSDAGIKVIETTSYRDLKPITDMAYRGNIIILDFSRFSDGDTVKKDMSKRLQAVSKDINGAFTEVSDRMMIMSPGGMNIEKCRIRYKEN